MRRLGARPEIQDQYLYFTEDTARVLYAILKLQHDSRFTLPGATQRRLQKDTGLSQPQVAAVVADLQAAGYIRTVAVRGSGALEALESAKKLYACDGSACITCRDTAVVLLELQRLSQQSHEEKVDFRLFGKRLVASRQLQYLQYDDLCGCPEYPGKLQEMVDGLYLTRISSTLVRLTGRVRFEQLYLQILRDQPSLSDLSRYSFARETV